MRWAPIALLLALCGCGLLDSGMLTDDCGGSLPPASTEPLSPIAKALRYLEFTQLKEDQLDVNVVDYAGDWPQCFAFRRSGPFTRDASPFMATFIHHALALITEDNRDFLGLTDAYIDSAAGMRAAAVNLMLRFEAGPGCPDAGAFGFWPHLQTHRSIFDVFLSILASVALPGPELMGVLAPINVSFYPPELAIPTDADDTASIYAVLLDHALLDGGREVEVEFERFFSDWRDLGQVPRRNNPQWLPPTSGAFLTWLAYHDDPDTPNVNDVDLVVNSNVLYALGRYGKLDTPGVAEAIDLINTALQAGVHVTDPDTLSLYYPDNFALHYCVSRAYREGGVSDLAPAVSVLTNDLLDSVQIDEAGRHFWDRGDAHLNTAFAVLALVAADYQGEVVERAIEYLLSEQNPDTGAWAPGVFFVGQLNEGVEALWVSPAFTTAVVVEALAKQRMATGGAAE